MNRGMVLKLILMAMFSGALSLIPAQANAQSERAVRMGSTTKGPFYHLSENELRSRKLMRGVANVVFAVAEIPNQAFREAYRTTPATGAIVGSGKGIVKGVKRVGVGFWEIATFYLPMANHYQPYIQPEVVMMEDLH